MTTQPRQPAGIPAGGEWATAQRGELDDDLLNASAPRTDTIAGRFAPSVFDPDLAELYCTWDNEDENERPDIRMRESMTNLLAPEARTRGGLNRCTICGQYLRYVTMWDSPYGRFIAGEDCADSLRIAQKLGKRVQDLKAKAAEQRMSLKNQELRNEILEQYPDLAHALRYSPQNEFLADLNSRLHRGVSEKQIDAAIRTARRIEEREARETRWRQMPKSPVPVGRGVVTGEVVGTRMVESYFGYRPTITEKMTVVDDRGFKVWCTVPRGIEVKPGSRVTFTATLEESSSSTEDSPFGFGSRPTKAQVL